MFHFIGERGFLAAALALLTGSAIALGVLSGLNLVPGEAFAGAVALAGVSWLVASHYAMAHHVNRTHAELVAVRDEIRLWRDAADAQNLADLCASVDAADNIRRLR